MPLAHFPSSIPGSRRRFPRQGYADKKATVGRKPGSTIGAACYYDYSPSFRQEEQYIVREGQEIKIETRERVRASITFDAL